MTPEERNKELSRQEFNEGVIEVACLPHYFILESWNHCNLDCVMCIEHGHPDRGLLPGTRPLLFPKDLLHKLENFLATAYYCNFEGYGEPFISDPFWEMVSYTCEVSATRNFPKIYIASNGNFDRPEERFARAVQPFCKTMTFSVQAASPELYHNIMGGDFARARDNIFSFIRMRNAAGLDMPVYINTLLMRGNIHELPDLVRIFTENPDCKIDVFKTIALKETGEHFTQGWIRRRGDYIFDYKQEVLTPKSIGQAQQYYDEAKAIATANKTTFWGAPIFERLPYQEAPDKKGRCPYPWEFFQVLTNGDVMACLYLQDKPIGNLWKQTPEEIWNGPEYRKMREEIVAGTVPERCRGCLCPFSYEYE